MKFWSAKLALRAGVPVAIVAALGFYWFASRSPDVKYVTAPVTRGTIVRAVTATGTVNPVITVQVGSYVSGPIQALYADFNSTVKKGQLIAKIDPRPFQVKVAEAKAALDNAKAQLRKDRADRDYKKLTYERNRALLKSNAVSQDTVDSSRSAYEQAEAQVKLDEAAIEQDQASLREAEINLDYTNIVSPVDGTVVSRNVDVGQTVAASFQTPTLFLIAQDLTKMQVDASVSESDIGDVRTGQGAEFTVDAYGDREFEGTVGQVRQAPITVQNVVTYDVVVNVPNPELLLKPGMTANVTIVTARRDNVVRVPMEALRFSPKGLAVRDGAATGATSPSRHARVWVPDGVGIKPISITTGLDDGSNVELLGGELRPGDMVVTDEIRAAAPKSRSSSVPHFPH
jgi:HlyD family secretion protein